eukprot:CAMPEP_0168452328 /NCGR_PEP_ID=MMETSP0228-20121227/49096_1 /TAXON_ID=133427 /ORGANISM="Protoceratium reticulatum, Strain CCCM 535 (=CCMP 1889)" /LENGTH=118 /DNA_ID=CAMNT_0008466975 /DNA_START=33 /DNA_END=389 /DNA_ORIENTATION=+
MSAALNSDMALPACRDHEEQPPLSVEGRVSADRTMLQECHPPAASASAMTTGHRGELDREHWHGRHANKPKPLTDCTATWAHAGQADMDCPGLAPPGSPVPMRWQLHTAAGLAVGGGA